MTQQRLVLGKRGEELAVAYLERLGYRVLVRNYRVRLGEVDIIAVDGDTLVFVEVKSRRGREVSRAFEVVTPRKQRQLSKVALEYIGSHGKDGQPARFDVVAVLFAESLTMGETVTVEVVRNAFDLCYGI